MKFTPAEARKIALEELNRHIAFNPFQKYQEIRIWGPVDVDAYVGLITESQPPCLRISLTSEDMENWI